ncbi:MAG: BrnT family toxin [Candidatus Binatia bacterium]
MSLKFEWDHKKAASNLSKHGVSFDEALTVFGDPLARIFDDEDHSIAEQREIIIGHSVKERLLVACFTSQGESVRILSARKATRKEQRDYEENVKS